MKTFGIISVSFIFLVSLIASWTSYVNANTYLDTREAIVSSIFSIFWLIVALFCILTLFLIHFATKDKGKEEQENEAEGEQEGIHVTDR